MKGFMNDRNEKLAERILERHLEHLADAPQADTDLPEGADAAAMSDRLGRILRPLDSWNAAPAPGNLADRVMDRVRSEQAGQILSFEQAQQSHRPRFALSRDLLGAAACILLLMGVFVPGISSIRHSAQKTRCASNMQGVFGGLSVYSQNYASALPFAGNRADGTWLPMKDGEHTFESNSRHLYLLVRDGLVPADAMLCPSDADAKPMKSADLTSQRDFASRRNVSYDSLNLAGVRPNLRPQRTVAYLGDRNPLFTDGKLPASANPNELNSPLHGGRGQMVLTTDGSAVWTTTPLFGETKDNLWTIGDRRVYTGTETTDPERDVQLVPGLPRTK